MRNIFKIHLLVLSFFCSYATTQAQDTIPSNKGLQYPLEDRDGDFFTEPNNNPFYLDDPDAIEQSVNYDPETDRYVITETVNGKNIKPPTYLTFDEYLDFTLKEENEKYWKSRSSTEQLLKDKNVKLPFEPGFNPKLEGGIFRGLTIDIRPQGNVEVTLGGNVQKYDNPNLPQRARTQGGFDFDMNINMNVTGKIGDALALTLKYNNQTGFAFDNQFKLQYTGDEDDIIQLIEAGNVSFPLQTQLITGAQSLRGIKTQMRFGKLTMTNIVAEQQSQKQSVILEDGAQTQTFEIKADQYETDKHFFLTQFFRDSYDQALVNLPNILSQVNIEEIEVWVTNRTGQTNNVRDVVAFLDLAEGNPFNDQVNPLAGQSFPNNDINDLYNRLTVDPNLRVSNNIVSALNGPNFNFEAIQDYEKTYARLLSNSEYILNSELGFISLQTALQPNQVLGVAFKYTYNGQVFQVGELSRNVPPDSSSVTKTLFVKMIRSSAIRPDLPTWDLMMKNIYSLGAYQISPNDFRLDIFYLDPGGGQKRFIPKGNLSDQQLIRVLSLDKLNNQGDPQPDGLFDFQPGITIIPQNGRLIFPVIEPFGGHLEQRLIDAGDQALVDDYTFSQLYDSTLFIAQQFPEKNRFVIKGRYQGNGGNRIQLGAFQLPENSVTVSLGGILLTEGQDYNVDYNLGVVTIINEGLLSSGQQIKVDYENNALFGFQQRSLMASRLDYRVSENVFIGGTVMKMKERPFSQKVNLGSDPINNTIMGMDFRMNTDLPFLTRILDKLPIYSTTEMSNISIQGEVAHLRPGHNKFVEQGDEPVVYIDDFEGSSSAYDLKGSPQTWRLASTPKDAKDRSGNILFPEAELNDQVEYGYNRAKLAWFNVDPTFFQNSQSPPEVFDDKTILSNHYVRPIFQVELYPNKDVAIQQQIFTLDLAYYPEERGPYNYEQSNNGSPPFSRGVRTDGRLIAPDTRWGGIMRGIDNNNFEVANIEYIEFWMMDPFIYNDNSSGGQMYINLGNISEDILKDSRMQYEHGLSDDLDLMDTTKWGQVPRAQPIINTFSNEENLRPVQDVGFDGLNDAAEAIKFRDFLDNVQVDPNIKAILEGDPSSDNFTHYLDPLYDGVSSIIDRYRTFNNPSGNSPLLDGNTFLAGSNTPDQEDLNRDNSLNENEQYFQYIVDLFPGMNIDNHPFIISTNVVPANSYFDEQQPEFTWYQFRIPIFDFGAKVGNIQDFRSIQYMRMFLTNWQDPVNIRFGSLELVRNQWRTFQFELTDATDNLPIDEDATFFNVTQVNIEENGEKDPVNYILPPDILREQGVANNANQLVAQNEQSLALNVCGLKDGDSRAVFKNVNLDFRNYDEIIMDVHANRFPGQPAPQDGALTAFIRLGIDFRDNYYQIETPLVFTPDGDYADNDGDRALVWPNANKFEISLRELIEAKQNRNAQGWPLTVPFSDTTSSGKIITIKGVPDLGAVQITMLGIRNPAQNDINNPLLDDDGSAQCAEVWMNELRLSGFDERPGSAALASMSIKLADLGNINLSTSVHSIGFGQVDMQVDERFQDTYYQYDFSTNLQLGKFLPAKANIMLPFYGGISQTFSTPEFDPYQLDITSKEQLKSIETFSQDSAQSYKRQIQTIVTRKGFNFTNVRKLPGENQKRLFFFSPENVGLSYAYNVIERSDPFVESDLERTHIARFDYAHSMQPKYLYPFKKVLKGKSKYNSILKEININFFPSTMAFNTQMNRQYGELNLRSLDGDDFSLPTTFNKFFTWDRNYTFRYNPFKSLSVDYASSNAARIDEPFGRIDTDEEKEEIWNNISRGGRTTLFSQTLNVNYTLPLNKLPILDFTNTTFRYGSGFNWIAAPLRADVNGDFIANPLGNTMSNTQQMRFSTDWNFDRLYAKVPYLKKFTGNNPTAGNKEATQKKRESIVKAREKIDSDIDKLKEKRTKEKENLATIKVNPELEEEEKKEAITDAKIKIKGLKKQIKKRRRDKKTKQAPAKFFENLVMQPLLSLKKVSAAYTENRATTLPGYMPDTDFIGADRQSANAPGFGFVFGGQPGYQWFKNFDADKRNAWLDDAASNGWVSTDSLQNRKFTQVYSQNLDIRATLEPFRDLKIDINVTKTNTVNHSQFFKVIDGSGDFDNYLPQDFGTYQVSAITWKTMFQKYDDDWLNETYTAFIDNRSVISNRLQDENPNSTGIFENPSDTTNNPGYAQGYGPTSQDVLIPAFLAAYQGKNAGKVRLNPFKTMPKPNWQISYNGLTRFKWAQKIFSNFSIRHGYNSTIQIGSFQTNFDYDGNGGYTEPVSLDSLNGNFYSLYNVPNIVINEQLNPLIGFDMTFKNGIQARIDYKKSRTVTMNFTDFQMIENLSSTITAGVGYRVKGLKLPFKAKGKKVILHNDLNMRFDFSYRDNVIVNHQLDQGVSRPTSGSTVITVSPSIDYVINKQLNIRIFMDRNRTIPKTTASFPTTTTRAGITLRFSLASF